MGRFIRRFIFFVGCLALVWMFAWIFIRVGSLTARAGQGANLESGRVVGIASIKGQITTADDFRKELEKQVRDDHVKAIVVQIDTPGGAVGASEEIYRLIRRADEKKPVVALLENVAASGGMYAAVGARKIISHAGTLTGSIGVIFMSPNVSALSEQWGVNMLVVKSGALKDAGSPFRKPTDRDLSYLQSVVDQAYDQFLTTVATGRKLDKETLRPIADGRVILGEEALKHGLVDEIGDLQRAGSLALELAGITGEPEFLFPERPSKLETWLEGASHWGDLFSAVKNPQPGLYYLAWP